MCVINLSSLCCVGRIIISDYAILKFSSWSRIGTWHFERVYLLKKVTLVLGPRVRLPCYVVKMRPFVRSSRDQSSNGNKSERMANAAECHLVPRVVETILHLYFCGLSK